MKVKIAISRSYTQMLLLLAVCNCHVQLSVVCYFAAAERQTSLSYCILTQCLKKYRLFNLV